jgi:hypothetical protein
MESCATFGLVVVGCQLTPSHDVCMRVLRAGCLLCKGLTRGTRCRCALGGLQK